MSCECLRQSQVLKVADSSASQTLYIIKIQPKERDFQVCHAPILGSKTEKGKAGKIPVPEIPFPVVDRDLILLSGYALVRRSDVWGQEHIGTLSQL